MAAKRPDPADSPPASPPESPGDPAAEVSARAELTLAEARRRLAELADAVAARDNFLAVAAHELRNPMTPIVGQIELLLRGMRAGKYAPEQIEAGLERLQRSMAHYLKRAATLLDVSRIASGKFTLAPAPCDLADVIRVVADAFDEPARHAGTVLNIAVPPTLVGCWDHLALEQIVDNLVSNAIKYGGKNPVHVSASEQPGGSHVAIAVRDHGPGISPHNRQRIFGQFERAIGAEERQTGFGVGLWVVGQIVEAMEGTIAVQDAQGGGTVFTVVLPRHVSARA